MTYVREMLQKTSIDCFIGLTLKRGARVTGVKKTILPSTYKGPAPFLLVSTENDQFLQSHTFASLRFITS
jgi:hypothetical protein